MSGFFCKHLPHNIDVAVKESGLAQISQQLLFDGSFIVQRLQSSELLLEAHKTQLCENIKLMVEFYIEHF